MQSVLMANGRESTVTADDLSWLVAQMKKASKVNKLSIEGLKPENRRFPGG